jgi:hypothetical protein
MTTPVWYPVIGSVDSCPLRDLIGVVLLARKFFYRVIDRVITTFNSIQYSQNIQ